LVKEGTKSLRARGTALGKRNPIECGLFVENQ